MGDRTIDSAAGAPVTAVGTDLHALAAARPELAWQPGTDIARARNAHTTNTRQELAGALRSDANYLEGDVRVGPEGELVMQHDPRDRVDLSLDDWLSVGVASGRGVKVDVKERSALEGTVAAVRRAGVPEDRLIFNVPAWPAGDLLAIRRAFPKAIINLSPTAKLPLTASELVRLQLAARVVDGAVMFPIRQELVTAGVVRALQPYGRIAVWNTPGITNPGRGTEAELRRHGVDGMIDLREPNGSQYVTSALAQGAARVVGWEPVLRAIDALGYF